VSPPVNPIVRVRALMLYQRSIVVVRANRKGKTHLSLPGGRVKEGEGITDALVREIDEETGRSVKLGALVYVAEVRAPHRRHDVNLIFRALPTGPADDLELVSLDGEQAGLVLPPVLDQVREDLKAEWPEGARWLGNLWNSELGVG
jgi:8-oxo-dGTP diphosphatase